MNGYERVCSTLNFKPVDYIPLFDQFWGGFANAWRERHGLPPKPDNPLNDLATEDLEIQEQFRMDLYKIYSPEATWPGAKQTIERRGDYLIERDGWGRTIRRLASTPYGEPIELPLADKSALDTLEFEPVDTNARYEPMLAGMRRAQAMAHQPYIYIKVGGPYLRSSFLRGEIQWYMDIVNDPPFARALGRRMTDHLIAVALEAWRRSGLSDTSIWIFDDVATNNGPLISPASYEQIFLPEVRRMVEAFRAAGVKRVGMHSDGDLRPILDGLVDAGISILNPVEPRANMDVVHLRERYGRKLCFCGGLCNSRILPHGSDDEVRRHVEHVLSVYADGGLIVGSHSIGNDISLERYDLVMQILHETTGRPLPGK